MTPDILTFLSILAVTMVLFLSGKLPYDMVAIATLILLFFLDFLDEKEVLSGFSSSAVIIYIGTFFIAGALKRTGVASFIANSVASKIGTKESRNVIAVMLLGALVSAFMSNVASVALLLPTVVAIAQINKVHISRLLIPLSFAVVLGGLLTLIGTSANIIATELQQTAGLETFSFFEFTPFGFVLVVVATAFMSLYGRKLLPKRSLLKASKQSGKDLRKVYRFNEQLLTVKVKTTSKLIGSSLAESNLGRVLGVRVVALYSRDSKRIFPGPSEIIQAGDKLLVYGHKAQIEEMLLFEGCELHSEEVETLESLNVYVREISSKSESKKFLDQELSRKFSLFYIEENGVRFLKKKEYKELSYPCYAMILAEEKQESSLIINKNHVFSLYVNETSDICSKDLRNIKSIKNYNFKVLGLKRGEDIFSATESEIIQAGDRIICFGNVHLLNHLLRINAVEIQDEESDIELESSDITITEVVLSPRSNLIGKNLVEAQFRDKYQFQVLAIWREGRPLRGNLSEVILKFGDALLIQGEKSQVGRLEGDSDFVLLYDNAPSERKNKAKYAVFALFMMIILSGFKIVPVTISVMFSAIFVVFSGALKIEEAYNEVSWKLVALVSALIPIGIAFDKSGSAKYISDLILSSTGDMNIYMLILFLGILASFISQILDVVIAVVIVGQIAISLATQMQINSEPLLMAVTLSASIAFLTPFSHKAHLLVMGAGGYRIRDYFRTGSLLTVLLMLAMLLMIPLIYSL